MYLIKDYLTDETVAIVSRKEDALAMIQRISNDERKLIIEEK